jgi:hypothetical protein
MLGQAQRHWEHGGTEEREGTQSSEFDFSS